MKIIIANSNIGAMLQASRDVLKKYEKNVIPENIKGQAVLSVLKDITQNRSFFSIVGVNELAKMNEVIISTEHREFMQTLHCINWSDMHTDTREYLVAILIDYFAPNLAMVHTSYETVG